MNYGGGGGQQQTDQTANFFWLLVILCGVAMLLWIEEEKYIVAPVFFIRDVEIDFIRWLTVLWMPVAQFFHLPPPHLDRLQAIQTYIQQADPSKVGWHNFASINAEFGRWVRYPVMAIFFVLALFAYFRQGVQFHHIYSMKSLRTIGQEVWPQITPISSVDLVKEDLDTGPWSMAMPPLLFCRKHNLLMAKTAGLKKIWTLKQKPAYRLFVLQLGPLWKGLDALPIHAKALAYIFLARAAGQRADSNVMLKQISASAVATGQLDFSGVSLKLKAFYRHRIIQWLEKRHAYTTTLLATLLEIARSDGVLASAEFLWLKPVDRRLWFVLNSIGRRTAVVEVAGVYAHWVAEKKVGFALKTPMVKGAVDALDEALHTMLVVEEAESWRDVKEG